MVYSGFNDQQKNGHESIVDKFLGQLGVQFYKKSLSPSDQIDGLFSGCSDILTDDADRWECLTRGPRGPESLT